MKKNKKRCIEINFNDNEEFDLIVHKGYKVDQIDQALGMTIKLLSDQRKSLKSDYSSDDMINRIRSWVECIKRDE